MHDDYDKRTEIRTVLNSTANFNVLGQVDSSDIINSGTAKIINISATGMGILTPVRLSPGDILEVSLEIGKSHKSQTKFIKVSCKTQWCKNADNGGYEAGLDFIIIAQEDVRKILKVVPEEDLSRSAEKNPHF
jgi:c-di-GMP-binding flagellar brake protein YcgR